MIYYHLLFYNIISNSNKTEHSKPSPWENFKDIYIITISEGFKLERRGKYPREGLKIWAGGHKKWEKCFQSSRAKPCELNYLTNYNSKLETVQSAVSAGLSQPLNFFQYIYILNGNINTISWDRKPLSTICYKYL